MPFDVMAETYDEAFSFSEIGKLQREGVWRKLLPLLGSHQKPLRILEINCGTGVDALRLATLGHHVIATDASAVMIDQATQKIHDGVKDNLQFLQLSFAQLSGYNFNTTFDLVFSNFGGLNCIDKKELRQLDKDLARITNENATLFFVVMGKFCVWETTYHLLAGKWKTAIRRIKGESTFTVNGNTIPVHYYTPGSLNKLFGHYHHCYSHAVGFFVPPSYLESFFEKHPVWLKRLGKLEKKINSREWLSLLSDHYCTVLKKK